MVTNIFSLAHTASVLQPSTSVDYSRSSKADTTKQSKQYNEDRVRIYCVISSVLCVRVFFFFFLQCFMRWEQDEQ